jgi:hypothetical protein
VSLSGDVCQPLSQEHSLVGTVLIFMLPSSKGETLSSSSKAKPQLVSGEARI